MADLRHVEGLKEVTEAFRKLPKDLRRVALNEAVMAAARIVRNEARATFRRKWKERTGRLARAIVMKGIKEKTTDTRVTYYVLVKKNATSFARNRRALDLTKRTAGQRKGEAAGSTFYWRFLEFGTSYIRARPFMRPAFEAKVGDAISAIRDVSKKSIQEIVNANYDGRLRARIARG
jgi:HK97 gp10 family phage protein